MRNILTIGTFVLLAALSTPATAEDVAAPANAAAPSAVLSTPRGAVAVSGAEVHLGDVFSPLPANLANADGTPSEPNPVIAAAPALGQKVVYDVNILSRLSQRYALGWRPVRMDESTTITRAATVISPDNISKALIGLVQAKAEGKDISSIALELDRRAQNYYLPPKDGVSEAQLSVSNFTYDASAQRFTADVLATVPDEAPLLIPVTGRVVQMRQVATIGKSFPAGATIAEGDVTWQDMPADRVAPDSVTDAATLANCELRRPIQAGQVLRARDLRPARIVKRGQIVTLQVSGPGLSLSTQGRALVDGAVGESIKVANTQSNRVVIGTVGEDGTVLVTASN